MQRFHSKIMSSKSIALNSFALQITGFPILFKHQIQGLSSCTKHLYKFKHFSDYLCLFSKTLISGSHALPEIHVSLKGFATDLSEP